MRRTQTWGNVGTRRLQRMSTVVRVHRDVGGAGKLDRVAGEPSVALDRHYSFPRFDVPCSRPGKGAQSFAGKSGVVMSKDVLRLAIAAICAIVCVACPITIDWFGEKYWFDRLRSDEDFRLWRVHVV